MTFFLLYVLIGAALMAFEVVTIRFIHVEDGRSRVGDVLGSVLTCVLWGPLLLMVGIAYLVGMGKWEDE